MNIKTLETHLVGNGRKLRSELASDAKAEFDHVIDPAQCGSIVRRHFDGIVLSIYVFIGLFLIAAMVGVMYFTVRN